MLGISSKQLFWGSTIRFGNTTPLTRDQRIDRHIAVTEQPGFQQAFADVINRAKQAIITKLAQGQKGMVVFDVDDTALDNRDYFRDPQRQYYKSGPGLAQLKPTWQAWVNRAATPAIPVTKMLIEWLNVMQVPYCFLTGIFEDVKPASVLNLQREGLWGPMCLGGFYRPVGEPSTKQFKLVERPRLEQLFNLPIIATIGDMLRDMTGNPDVDFLLPGYTPDLRKENDHG